MERRVTLFEARLRKQYATLDSTLGVLQQQSNWLAGQIAGLMQ
jgi:flagellar capping protein FliD